MDVQQQLGAKVAELRKLQGLSQTQLAARLGAEKLGVGQSYISELEAGKKNPNLVTLAALSNALGVELSEMLNFKS